MAARHSTGGVVVDTRRKSPVYALRFRALGKRQYVTLGTEAEGWTKKKAEDELRRELMKVELGIWQPPAPAPIAATPATETDPSFHEFASRWFHLKEGGWRPNTKAAYKWEVTDHLLPFFAGHRLSQITVAEVDRYRQQKVREGRLSAESINKTLTRLGQILDLAVEYQHIEQNPLRVNPRNRKLKAARPAPVWLDRAQHIAALLDAAGELDRRAKGRRDRRHIQRRAMLATLVFAGLRIGELLELRWRDVDLGAGRIIVRQSKTSAGVRQVDVLPVLRDVLVMLDRRGPNELVFPTSNGKAHGATNIRRRVLAPAVNLANERLQEAGEVPLPSPLTPHKLRHTFASVLVALGVDPGAVMDQLGHTDPTFTLRVYRHGMRRDDDAKRALRELVGGGPIGQQSGSSGVLALPANPESLMGTAGLEPATSRV